METAGKSGSDGYQTTWTTWLPCCHHVTYQRWNSTYQCDVDLIVWAVFSHQEVGGGAASEKARRLLSKPVFSTTSRSTLLYNEVFLETFSQDFHDDKHYLSSDGLCSVGYITWIIPVWKPPAWDCPEKLFWNPDFLKRIDWNHSCLSIIELTCKEN